MSELEKRFEELWYKVLDGEYRSLAADCRRRGLPRPPVARAYEHWVKLGRPKKMKLEYDQPGAQA